MSAVPFSLRVALSSLPLWLIVVVIFKEMFRRGFLIGSKAPATPATHVPAQPVEQRPEPMVTVPTLPPELTDRILDHLEGDRQALANCGLVCRTWLPRSRYHFFRELKLTSKNTKQLVQLLRDGPAIGQHVSHLAIVTLREDNSEWHVDLLPKVLPSLPNVTTLELRGRGAYQSKNFKDIAPVTSLKFHACEFAALKDVTTLLCAFPRLDTLTIESTLIARGEEDPSLTDTYRPPIKNITVMSSALNPEPFVNWLVSGGVHEGFESLTLLPIQKPALIPVGKFIKSAGPSLKHFEIALLEVGPEMFTDIFEEHFSLSHCTMLRSIAFASPFEYAMAFQTGHASFSWIASMLSQVTSRDLEEVSFTVYPPDTIKFTTPEWKHMAKLLQSDQFKNLKRVRFLGRCLEDTEGNNIVKRIQTVLPDLDKRGLLQVEIEVIQV
ncbi:hypothetical protein CERSUDRAFT_112012 [Gelatoporia subvermispora B]|uniref:F-box domain-containing protein n=1 Tax=Ceriporiopsis subvermispora (strain B) TaxID=914234 RepID=M2QRJ4_CERS8|nr:hypothetical protein CERSUDRAFT_112012 [Gelatoporia subvermispora B]